MFASCPKLPIFPKTKKNPAFLSSHPLCPWVPNTALQSADLIEQAETPLTKPKTALARETQHATTAVNRATLARTAPTLRRSAHATAAAMLATSLVNALKNPAGQWAAWAEARNAISAAALVILRGTAPKVVVAMAVAAVASQEAMVVAAVATAAVAVRLVTLAVAMDICLGTAPRAKSATIVS